MKSLAIVGITVGVILAAYLPAPWFGVVVAILMWATYGFGWWNGRRDITNEIFEREKES